MFTSPLAAVTTPGNCCSVCSPFHTSTYSCSWSEYREMLKLKPLQLDPSKNNYFSPSTVHFPGWGWYLRDEAWSKHFSVEHQAGPERCFWFRACGRGSGKDTQGRKGNRFRWKQRVWSCSPPASQLWLLSAFHRVWPLQGRNLWLNHSAALFDHGQPLSLGNMITGA